MNIKSNFGFWLILSFNLLGCGDAFLSHPPKPVSTAAFQSAYWNADELLSEEQAVGEFTCPTAPNVLPAYDWDLDGTNRYRVCFTKNQTGSLLVFGEPSETEKSNMICVFPLEYIDRKHVYIKPDIAQGGTLFRCAKASDSGAIFNFPSTNLNFNMVLIVESKDLEKTQTCLDPLRGVDFFLCPPYAYGKFR